MDNEKEYRRLVRELRQTSPELASRTHQFREKSPIFEKYNIENELEKTLERKVWLKKGGYICIDHAEALVAIDVNTGRFTGKKNQEETIFRTNMEAAHEIPRQLRLRDIGGIIVVDFIDMESEANKRAVLDTLRPVGQRIGRLFHRMLEGLEHGLNYNEVADEFRRNTESVDNPFYGILPATSTIGASSTFQANRMNRPFPQFDSVTIDSANSGRSIYHSLQTRFQKRTSNGFTFVGAYTYSKIILYQMTTLVNQRAYQRYIPEVDFPHILRLFATYDLPIGREGVIGTKWPTWVPVPAISPFA